LRVLTCSISTLFLVVLSQFLTQGNREVSKWICFRIANMSSVQFSLAWYRSFWFDCLHTGHWRSL
jgi:hypothetical protein